MEHKKIKLGLGGFLAISALALGSGCTDDNLVRRERIHSLKWISEYKNGERSITDNHIHELHIFIDRNNDNKVDEYVVLGASRVSLTYWYKLKGSSLDGLNFEKEERIFREYQSRSSVVK